MPDLVRRIRRASPRTLLAAALGAAVTAAGIAAALLDEYGLALAAALCLLAAVPLLQSRANARLRRQLTNQHRQEMRYAIKADQRLRRLDARVDLLNRTLDVRARETSADLNAAARRILGAVETERYAAAERHQSIAASLDDH